MKASFIYLVLALASPCISVVWSENVDLSAMSFLENYGYIMPFQNSYNLISQGELKRSIRIMQKYANLPQTGLVDQRTIDKMKSPRCGLPDVISNETKHTKKRNRRFAIYGTSSKWTSMPVTWSIKKPSRTFPTDTARSVFARAFNLWEKATTNLKFVEISSEGTDANIKIGFYVGEHECGRKQSFDGPGSKLAHAFSPPKGDIHFDDDEDWLSQSDGLDLYWTALHEIGHSLGFAHTADESSIMFPYYQDHGPNFQIPDGDKAGLRYLYGKIETNKENFPLPAKKTTQKDETTTTSNSNTVQVDKNSPCDSNIDAIASIRGNVFIFKNNVFWWLKNDLEMMRNEPIPVSQYFMGFPEDITKIDAVYERKSDQKIMFFVGKQYWLFSANQYYAGPKPLTDLGLPYDLDGVDAVTNWGLNGKAYIFAGSIFWRLDETETKVQSDYPRDMSMWKQIPNEIDAAFTWEFDSLTYFFKGSKYWKFNNRKLSAETDYPKLIHNFWFRSLKCSDIVQSDFIYQRPSNAWVNDKSILLLITVVISNVLIY